MSDLDWKPPLRRAPGQPHSRRSNTSCASKRNSAGQKQKPSACGTKRLLPMLNETIKAFRAKFGSGCRKRTMSLKRARDTWTKPPSKDQIEKKNVREADRDAMRLHVGELSTNFGHEFFANQSSLSAPAAGAQEAEQDEDAVANVRVMKS